jgi:hypothetical protein
VDQRIRADGRRTEGWRGTQTLVGPAFAQPFADPVELASALSEAAGTVGEVPREPIRGGTLAFEDAMTLARHLVVGDEVAKRDMLASLKVEIVRRRHRLAATPFEDARDGRLRCAITGVVVRPLAD